MVMVRPWDNGAARQHRRKPAGSHRSTATQALPPADGCRSDLQGAVCKLLVPWIRYVAEEKVARANRLGLWAGQFVPPWEWRRGKRLEP